MDGGRGEGQEEEENRPRGCTGSAFQTSRIEKQGPEIKRSRRDEALGSQSRRSNALVIAAIDEMCHAASRSEPGRRGAKRKPTEK